MHDFRSVPGSTDPAPNGNGIWHPGGARSEPSQPWRRPWVDELDPDDVADAGIRACLQLYHDAARGLSGVFVLGFVDPPRIDRETRKELDHPPLRSQRFKIGDVDGMAAEAQVRGQGANAYFAPAVIRSELQSGGRGKKRDIVATLGLVIDDDSDGKDALRPPGIEPSFEIITSTSPTTNRQPHYVFSRPVPPEEAEGLAELLHRKCGGDHGTADIAHVWRLPGTRNYPNAAKLARGRPLEPQSVALAGGTFERIDPDQLRRALEMMPDQHPPRRTKGNDHAESYTVGSTNRDAIVARLPGGSST